MIVKLISTVMLTSKESQAQIAQLLIKDIEVINQKNDFIFIN